MASHRGFDIQASRIRCIQSTSDAVDSYGSITSFEDLGIDVETVIGDGGMSTAALVDEARTIANSTIDVVLHEYKNCTVYVGVLLHALLDYAGKNVIPDRGNITGERYAAGVIYAAYQSRKVGEAALVWFESMIRPMKIAGSTRTVEPSEEQTPQEDIEEMAILVEPATTSGQGSLRVKVSERQNYRCILHDEVDRDAPPGVQEILEESVPSGLEIAHIIPFALNSFALGDNGAINTSAVTWVMIKNWTAVSIQNLMGEGINDPTNAILFCRNGHDYFGYFSLFFEPTGVEHCYVTKSHYRKLDNLEVDFRSTTTVPPPNPLYLAIHAAFAKVLRASGAAEYIEMCNNKNLDEIRVLATDGSTDISTLLMGRNMMRVR